MKRTIKSGSHLWAGILATAAAVSAASQGLAQQAPAPNEPAPPVATFPESTDTETPGEASPPAAPAPPPAAVTEPPPAPGEPPPPAPPPPRSSPLTATVEAEPEGARFYITGSLLAALHFHGATYNFEESDKETQGAGGGGYELTLMLGSKKKNFAFGGAVSFVHVPSAVFTWNDERMKAPGMGIFGLTVGPAVDYYATRHFFIGGLLGLAVERVPEFQPLPDDSDTLFGGGIGIWLGFDWEIARRTRLGLVLNGHFRQTALRDIKGSRDGDDAEGSLSLSLGARIAQF